MSVLQLYGELLDLSVLHIASLDSQGGLQGSDALAANLGKNIAQRDEGKWPLFRQSQLRQRHSPEG